MHAYVIKHALPQMGLVDVNTVIAWYYGELVLNDPIHAIHGMSVTFRNHPRVHWELYSTRDRNVLLGHIKKDVRIINHKHRAHTHIVLAVTPRYGNGVSSIEVEVKWPYVNGHYYNAYHYVVVVPPECVLTG
jgi:hypothetical protein